MFDDFNLSELSLEELYQQMGDDLYDGYQEEVVEEVEEALHRGVTPYGVLTEGLVAGMDIVGQDFRDGILFVPEVLMAANAMKAGMTVLRPLLAETGAPVIGKIIIGTVKGDIHDIGKNLVAMMLEGAGFKIQDLGIDVAPETFVEAIRNDPNVDIVGLSALLTTTMPSMDATIKAIDEAGLRGKVKIMVGGAPVTSNYSQRIKADGYAPDAGQAVTLAKSLLGEKSVHQ